MKDKISKFWSVYIMEWYVGIVNKVNIYVILRKYF